MEHSRSIKKTCVALAVAQAISFNVSEAATIQVNIGFGSGLGVRECTMREALELINLGQVSPPLQNGCSNFSSDPTGTNDIIEFAVSTISDLSDTLEITNDVTINPNGSLVTFFGNGNDRVFEIRSATVTMNSVSIRNGSAVVDDSSPDNYSGNGGGILTLDNTTLTLTNSTVTGNSAKLNGGGIFSDSSTVTLDDSTVSANSGVSNGGGVSIRSTNLSIANSTLSGNSSASQGGALYVSNSTVNIDNTNLLDNDAYSGAGIFATNSAMVEVSNGSISQNRASYNGGGVYSRNNASVKLIDTTISNNTTTLSGGGAYVSSDGYLSVERTALLGNSSDYGRGGALSLRSGHIEVSNSTISNNEASTGGGIAVYNSGSSTMGTLKLLNTTISDNDASVLGGGIFASGSSDTSMTNTIISANSSNIGPQDIHDSLGTSLTSNGFNLIGDSSLTNTESFDFTLNPNDITATSDGTQPTARSSILEPLADNGGPTQTHALIEGSPAIDAANNVLCAAAPVNNEDQRGEARSSCDIGAYEFQENISSFFVIPLPNGKSVVIEL